MAPARVKQTSDAGSYRLIRFAFLAWIAMVGVLAVMAAVKWNQPGFRDPDISGPFEMALTMAVVMGIPLALIAGGVLAPSAWMADRLIRGRFTRGANIIIGAGFSIPATIAFFSAGLLVYGNDPQLIENVGRSPDTLVGLLTIFAVGGVVTSLGMRRR